MALAEETGSKPALAWLTNSTRLATWAPFRAVAETLSTAAGMASGLGSVGVGVASLGAWGVSIFPRSKGAGLKGLGPMGLDLSEPGSGAPGIWPILERLAGISSFSEPSTNSRPSLSRASDGLMIPPKTPFTKPSIRVANRGLIN